MRVGVVTGKQLAEVCRDQFHGWTRYALWLEIELAIIGSDIQEVLGSAIALNILSGIPLWLGVVLTGLDTFFVLLIERMGVRKLEFVFGALIVLLSLAFFVVFGMVGPSWGAILEGIVVPTVPAGSVEQAVGTLGAVVMPHALFLHSAMVQSRKVDRTSKKAVDEAVYYFTLESASALLMSFFINMAVVAVFAHSFLGDTTIGLQNAGSALANGLGSKAGKYIWAIGILAAGQSSTMTGTWAGQFVMQGFLKLQIAQWKRTLLTRSIAIVPAVVVALLTHHKLDVLNEWMNVLQSLILPFAVLPLLKVSNSDAIMGPYKNKPFWRVFGQVVSVLVITINFYTVGTSFAQDLISAAWQWVLVALVGAAYFAFCVHLVRTPLAVHIPGRVISSDASAKRSLLDAASEGDHVPGHADAVPWWKAAGQGSAAAWPGGDKA